MNNHEIKNLKDPTSNQAAATKKYVDESHITSSTNSKDEFRYLMKDADESSLEFNIAVTGITDLVKSPHTFNKKGL